MSSTPRNPAAAPALGHSLRHLAVHLITPLLMCLGMALAYQGAFHQPEPHHLKVAVVGTTPQTQGLAEAIRAKAGDALDVRTLPDRAAAERQLKDRDLVAAFVPDARSPELIVAKGNSDTSVVAATAVFTTVTDRQGAPLHVTDLTTPAKGDPTGQGLFFLLVALSIGSYASVAVIGAAGAGLGMRIRALVGLAVSLVVSVIGIVTAGPLFHVVDHDAAAVWALGWLYSAGVILIGIGLHTFLRKWTTLTMMVLFVMLNFTTSGGIYRPELQNGFFGTLHGFWTGAGFMEGARSILYFDGGAGLGGHVLTLAVWLLLGGAAMVAAALYERRGRRPLEGAPDAGTDAEAEEEMEEAVAV
ncbi:ABC transporter permease [Streptomyces sp. SP17BM10]|uniref:ABC transporter permease n=1 Tax=Streptomyces sp. SP17BM10 TaxID=3002530 RepID=UPI002E776DEE|nr:ABC transporter permease [Streptomyces sp. SP17BM10]MEE1782018.1 ABC transporter permease [Streptomyces sp. SP17BM10]